MGFAVTPKQAMSGNFLFLAYPHLIYIGLGLISIGVGVWREGISPSVMTNISWVLFNTIMFYPFIKAVSAGWQWSWGFLSSKKSLKNLLRIN